MRRGTERARAPPSSGLPTTWLVGGFLFRSCAAQRRQEVDEGEDEDPDEIDEAPVQPEQLDLAFGDAATQVANEDGEDVADTDQYVQSVVAGDHVERARSRRLAEDEPFVHKPVPPDSEPFLVLPEEDRPPAERREPEQERGLPAPPRRRGRPSEHIRETGADEHEREQGGEGDPEFRLALLPPGMMACVEDRLRDEQAAEREGVRDEEDPHPDLPGGRRAVLRVRRPRHRR